MTTEKNAPMVDFARIIELIPSKGTLALMFSKTEDGQIVVTYSPKRIGKLGDDAVLRPMVLRGTVDELNADWETIVRDLGKSQEEYAEAANIPSIKSNVAAKRKEEVKKATDKAKEKKAEVPAPGAKPIAKKDAASTTDGEKGKDEKPEAKVTPKPAVAPAAVIDLFAVAPAAPAPVAVAPAAPASAIEAPVPVAPVITEKPAEVASQAA